MSPSQLYVHINFHGLPVLTPPSSPVTCMPMWPSSPSPHIVLYVQGVPHLLSCWCAELYAHIVLYVQGKGPSPPVLLVCRAVSTHSPVCAGGPSPPVLLVCRAVSTHSPVCAGQGSLTSCPAGVQSCKYT